MPPGVLPPLIMRMDAGSVPVGYLVLTSETESLGMIADLAQQRLRPLLQAKVPGTVGTAPFGSNVRSIVIRIDPERLRAYNLTPDEVVNALAAGNVITPAGNLYIKDQMPLAPVDAMIRDVQDFGSIPLRLGQNLYIHDVATIEDATDLNFGYAMVNGKRSVYIPVVKQNTASTLTVVADIHAAMKQFQDVLPESVNVSYEFDESPTVRESIRSVATEGLIGATLTGLMILLFLHDWRSVIVVVFNIPMALLASLTALWITGETINIMTLGGLALAIGMLVDEATVSIENIHVQMLHTKSLARAVERGSNETAVPRLLAMLCILSVFIPAFIMAEPVRSLFVPLSLAVGFAMIASYILSSTVVPVLSVWLLKHHRPHGEAAEEDAEGGSLFGRVKHVFGRAVHASVAHRWIVVPVYLGVCLMVFALGARFLGTELFPQVDSGEFVLRFRAPPGSNYELTREMWVRALEVVDNEAKAENVHISMGFAGQQAPNFGMNNMILFMRAPDDGQMRVQLNEDAGIRLDEFRERLRKLLPEQIKPWYERVLVREGHTADEAARRAAQIKFGFEPGDIVSEVMSFGSPTPIEIVVASPDLKQASAHARRIESELSKLSHLRDVQIQQTLDYPTTPITVDRQKAGLSGVTTKQVGDSMLVATSSSRMVERNYWQDPETGVSYQVQIEVPTQRMDKPTQAETIPLFGVSPQLNLLLRDVARVGNGFTPGEFDRTAMQRYVSVTANVEQEDLGTVADEIEQVLKRVGAPPRGVTVDLRGQIKPMREMFESLGIGLAVAVGVIVVLLTGYFQNWRLALVSIGAVPGVLSGVILMLLLTGTTLNIESFMGTIMCVGVSVSNSVMLVTFVSREWQSGKSSVEAAAEGAAERLRPIMMTACAMIVGMIPMSLALESGSQMEAPLGRAVVGGLLVSTIGTLLMLPPIFALVMGARTYAHPSLHPDDKESSRYDAEISVEAQRESPSAATNLDAQQDSPQHE